jgi:hypothetical protein
VRRESERAGRREGRGAAPALCERSAGGLLAAGRAAVLLPPRPSLLCPRSLLCGPLAAGPVEWCGGGVGGGRPGCGCVPLSFCKGPRGRGGRGEKVARGGRRKQGRGMVSSESERQKGCS